MLSNLEVLERIKLQVHWVNQRVDSSIAKSFCIILNLFFNNVISIEYFSNQYIMVYLHTCLQYILIRLSPFIFLL
jgi:hypothetical protein